MIKRRYRVGIAVGDVVAIAAVVLYGRVVRHGHTLLSVGTLETLLPFLFGWVVGSALLGLYTEQAFATTGWSLRLVTAAWFVAAALGLVARSAPLFSGSVTWPFGLVILSFVLIVLLLWRLTTVAVFRTALPDRHVRS